MVGLAHKMDSLPDQLSGGEQQRVSIARAFVNHPPLLVCDEPTGNLDPDTSVGIMQLLYRINRAGTTILMVTHDREMVDKMRQRVIALEDGRIARDERRGGYPNDRLRLIISEARRSMRANLSTTVAATMTVLIGMFLLGLFVALGSWMVSWSEPRQEASCSSRSTSPDAARAAPVNAVGNRSSRSRRSRRDVKKVKFVSKEEAS